MYRSIRRIYVTKPKSTKYISHTVPMSGEDQSYQSKCPVANSNTNNSPSNHQYRSTPDNTQNFQNLSNSNCSETTLTQQASGATTSWKNCLIPFLTTLAILSAIALAALALGIYAAIMLANQSTMASTTVSTNINNPQNNNTGVSLNMTSLNWTINATTVMGTRNVSGSTANLLNRPFSVFLDSLDTLYITDTGNNRLQKRTANSWSSTTTAGQSSGTAGATANSLSSPSSSVMDSAGNIYITDTVNHRIQCWFNGASSGTTIIGITGVAGSNITVLDTPMGIARDSRTGIIYVADSGNHRIMRYTPGSSIGTVILGGTGAGVGQQQLNNPRGIFFDITTNTLLIANSGANNIVGWTPGTTNWTLVVGSLTGLNGNTASLLNSPNGVLADSISNIYVADTGNHRIQLFSSGQANGVTIAGTTSVSGSTTTLLNEPTSVALDSQLNLYVVDQQNHRIQKFNKI